MGKKSRSKAGGDFWDEDPELAEQTVDASEDELSEEEESKAPQEANMEEEFDNGLLGALQRNKKKKDKRSEEAEAKKLEESQEDAGTVQVKSKKEKEREKKEREKAKKKAAAARKAASAPQKPKKVTETAEADEEDDGNSEASAAATAAALAKGGKKGKKGKLNPALAAIQKAQLAKAAAEEAARKKAEAEKLAAEEEERRMMEEEEAEEEARRIRREKKKAKEEELKKQGKFLTKKQKEQQALMARRREQLLASGVQVAGLMKDMDAEAVKNANKTASKNAKDEEDKKKAEEEKRKAEEEAKNKAAAEEEKKKQQAEKEEQAKQAEQAKQPEPEEEEDALLSDWEAALEDSDEEASSEPKKEQDESASTASSASQTTKNKEAESSSKSEEPEIDINQLRIDNKKRAEVDAKREQRHAKAVATATEENLRSPICAILGHVDTGKTKLLDNMRKTNVQEGEAGGITQQIGATYFPIDMIEKKAESMKNYVNPQFNVPGLLIIDTPGHESFSNLRSRGSSLCNIAILVVDILHGLEPQTLESIRLLRDRKTPFVVALNKIDRIYGWQSTPNNNFRDSLAAQTDSVKRQFEDRLQATKVLLAEQGFNSEVYHKNKNMSKYVSIVPTSAVTGEGVPDLLYLLLELTTSRMSKQLMYLSELEATILEVKVIEGLGTTIDVVLSNGVLREGDRIVLCGSNGPIATNVRALLTPQPARELRIKSQYVHHKEVKAALGVKISANDLEHAIAGSRLLLVGPNDDEDELMDDVMDDMSGLLDMVDKSGEGVCVQASTLGSLEALLEFLKDMKIPVMSIGLGPVYKRDVMRATTMLDRKPELALMLCFDVRVDKEAELYANDHGIKIFTADIIYHLFDEFQRYQAEMLEKRRQEKVKDAVYPAVLSIIQVINKRAPMIVGVDIVEGSLRIGTPIAIVKADPTTGMKLTYPLGRIQSMEVDHKSKDEVRKGQAKGGIAVRLDSGNMTNMPTWGRHITEKDQMYSLITRKSIDTLKDQAFRDSVPREDWVLIKKLKPIFDIN